MTLGIGCASPPSLKGPVKSGDLEAVRSALAQGADPNESKYEPLVDAAKGGYLAIVQELLEGGADIDGRRYNNTAISVAAGKGHWEIVDFLLSQGAAVCLDDDDAYYGNKGASALVSAMYPKDEGKPLYLQGVRRLLSYEKHAAHHSEALKAAVSHRRQELLEELLEAGADPQAGMASALNSSNLDAFHWLIAQGIQLELETALPRLLCGGATPHVGPRLPNTLSFVGEVLKLGAEPNGEILESGWGTSALMCAASRGGVEVARVVAAHGGGLPESLTYYASELSLHPPQWIEKVAAKIESVAEALRADYPSQAAQTFHYAAEVWGAVEVAHLQSLRTSSGQGRRTRPAPPSPDGSVRGPGVSEAQALYRVLGLEALAGRITDLLLGAGEETAMRPHATIDQRALSAALRAAGEAARCRKTAQTILGD